MIARYATILLLTFSLAHPAAPGNRPPRPLDLSEFRKLMTELSEPEGYFDTDNFISNERAYLKIVAELRRKGLRGGAYLGVGPDQNYSYIAELRPDLAIIIDIRRQNALQHLYFKSLFQLSRNRTEFLERLFGRKIIGISSSREPGIAELVRRIDEAASDRAFAAQAEAEAILTIRSWNLDVTSADYEAIHYVAAAFLDNGMDLRFRSHNRPPRPDYPYYRQLLTESDSDGIQSNYLAAEERFQFVKQMHRENRIIPIVGDLAGDAALRRTAAELRRRGTLLKCFYVSNVEFYLFGAARWKRYVENVADLPRAPGALLIRSYANSQPYAPGYYMGIQLAPIDAFLAEEFAGKHENYWDLIGN